MDAYYQYGKSEREQKFRDLVHKTMDAAERHSEYTNTAVFGTPDPGAEYKYNIDTWQGRSPGPSSNLSV